MVCHGKYDPGTKKLTEASIVMLSEKGKQARARRVGSLLVTYAHKECAQKSADAFVAQIPSFYRDFHSEDALWSDEKHHADLQDVELLRAQCIDSLCEAVVVISNPDYITELYCCLSKQFEWVKGMSHDDVRANGLQIDFEEETISLL